MAARDEDPRASGKRAADRLRSHRTRLFRRQYRLTPEHIAKLERLQSERGFASASDALRHAIDAHDPLMESGVAEILALSPNAWESEIAAACEHIRTVRAELARVSDPAQPEAMRAAVRDETRRYYAENPRELTTIANALFGR